MGAKQSKRSVDISGKEAESAGEVAAAGAGGEGRVEPLADADALKPQLNGDAHIHENTDKEKQLDSGTPENEKDATTEKEAKHDESEKENEATPVTNGDTEEQKTENGETALTPEESKKPKKEKVKKKWSLRSISFSRKEKPKQEKKQKEEEQKTNGETEKLPEEAAEVTADPVTKDDAEVKPETQTKDEKTPETPVTEPITNGSNTPESPKVEIPLVEQVVPEAVPEPVKTESNTDVEPEKLPINGLTLEEPKSDAPEIALIEEKKTEESPAESTETAPAIEIPVPKEVCVDQMPLIESTPPPLPANPPPSSVVSFAATTMAPDLTAASLVNTAETVISTPSVLDTKTELPKECPLSSDLTNNETATPSTLTKPTQELTELSKDLANGNLETPVTVDENVNVMSEANKDELQIKTNEMKNETVNGVLSEDIEKPVIPDSNDSVEPAVTESTKAIEPVECEILQSAEELPPPPPLDEPLEKVESIAEEASQDPKVKVVNSNFSNGDMINGIDQELLNGNTETEQDNANNKTVDSLGNSVHTECNGNIKEADSETTEETSGLAHARQEPIAKAVSPEESLPPSPSEAEAEAGGAEASRSDSFPAPPSDCRSPTDGSPEPDAPSPQESIAVSDKIADLIPELPVVPDLNTETLQETSDVVAAN